MHLLTIYIYKSSLKLHAVAEEKALIIYNNINKILYGKFYFQL